MAVKTIERPTKVIKRTCQGGKVKTSTLNKSKKRNFKIYRGQGK